MKSRRKGLLALRAAATAAVLLSLAGASLPIPTRSRTLVALIDVSDSVDPAAAEASRAEAIALMGALAPGDRAAAAVFAGKTVTIAPPGDPKKVVETLRAAPLSAPAPGSSDIAGAIAAGKVLAAAGGGTPSICLFSDGRANAGRAAAESAAALPRIPVLAVPAGEGPFGLVAGALSVPASAASGERVLVTWDVYSDRPRELDYELRVDGERAFRGAAALAAGTNEISIPVDSGRSGRRELIVEAASSGNGDRGRIRSGAYLDVSGAAEILIVAGSSSSPIAGALRAQGMRVRSGGPELLPEGRAGYAGLSAAVLDDVPALAMTEAQQSALQDYVASGGGLLVVGGDSSFGRGEYYATPLEDMLPVETDSRRRLQFTRAKLLFVIDHSGSMSDTVNGVSKQMAAMRGVAASIAELDPLDEVAIIGFDSDPTWILPFTPASEKAKILESLSRLGEGGGTDLGNALDEAIKGFGAPGPTKRHAIILTDGLTPEADFPGLAARLNAAGASASTIGIGDEVNEKLLSDLAERCGGTYHRATEAQIPSIIDKETVRMTRELIQEGKIETRILKGSPLLEGFGPSLPPISGYLLTKAKSLASVDAEAKTGGADGSWDPLLARWRYGNGRVAAFASDSGKRWLAAWSGAEAYNRLWVQALRYVERPPASSTLRASARPEGGGARVIAEARDPDRRALASLRLVGSVAPSGTGSAGRSRGASFELKETAPGRYEGFVPLEDKGLSGIDVLDPESGARASTWIWRPTGGETSGEGPDEASLSLIAASSGGALVEPDGLAPLRPRLGFYRIGLRSPLLALAVLLLVAELFLRSTMAGQLGRAAKAAAAWWEGQRALLESSRAEGGEGASKADEELKERRLAEMQIRLAEHVARRAERTAAQDALAGGKEREEDGDA